MLFRTRGVTIFAQSTRLGVFDRTFFVFHKICFTIYVLGFMYSNRLEWFVDSSRTTLIGRVSLARLSEVSE